MNRELTQMLYEKYPAIFASRCGFEHGDGWYDIIDAMCYTMSHSYKTWVIVDEARGKEWGLEPSKQTSDEAPICQMEVNPPQVVAVQVKEKFGTLRFYYELEFDPRFKELAYGDLPLAQACTIAGKYHSFMNGIVDLAETISARTCEETGKKGELHASTKSRSRWRKTLNREFAKTDEFCVQRNYVPWAELATDGTPIPWRLRMSPGGEGELKDQ